MIKNELRALVILREDYSSQPKYNPIFLLFFLMRKHLYKQNLLIIFIKNAALQNLTL